MNDLSVVEYFAGIGLMRLGLEQAGWQVVFANDFDPAKHAMYRAAFDDTHFDENDVFALSPDDVPLATLATCSFPCIDLSLAGKQNGIHGTHSSAFWGFIQILEAQGQAAPPVLLLENVPGWLNSNRGEDFRLTIRTLNDLGYACDVFELDALRFTPQSRTRIFVIATRTSERNDNLGEMAARPAALASKRVQLAVLQNFDLSWHFLPIPQPPPIQEVGFSTIAERIEDNDPRWWSDEKVQHHLAMMAPSHADYVQSLTQQETTVYRTVYRRMRAGQQRAEVRKTDTAGCLRTARGGSSRQIVIAMGQGRLRMRQMTAREYARLQGVPDNYPITVDERQALTGFGDAVCVPVIEWIATNILNRMPQVMLAASPDLSLSR